MKAITFIEKYGFSLVILMCIGALQPALYSKVTMMDTDLDHRMVTKSGGNTFKQVFWLGLACFFYLRFFVTRAHQKISLVFLKNACVLALICGIAFLSITWSSFPAVTFKRSIFQFLFCSTVMLSFYFAQIHDTLKNNIQYLLFILYALLALTILMGWGLTPGYSLAGFAKGKNLMGINTTVIIVMSYFLVKEFEFKIPHFGKHIVLLCLIVVLTQSKTCLFLIALYFTLIFFKPLIVKIAISSAFILFSSAFVLLPLLSYLYGDYTHIGDYVSEGFLTGRGLIWDTLYYDIYFFKKYWLGYGYGAYFGTPVTPYFFDDAYSFLRFINSPHNGYIGLLLQVGYIYTVIILLGFITLYRSINSKYIIAALILPIIHNVTESSMMRDNTSIWLLFLVAITAAAIKDKGGNVEQN